MCLIIQMTKELTINEKQFRDQLRRNGDGTGVMFAQNGRVIVKKTLTNIEEQVGMFNKYKKAVVDGGVQEVMIHSRFATKGAVTEGNLHPYNIFNPEDDNGDDLWCMHNGTINCELPEKDKSDSFNFLKYYVKPLLVNRLELLQDKYFIDMISTKIGGGSKLVFMDGKGDTTYVNKSAGIDYEGCWISNTYSNISKPKPKVIPPAPKKYGTGWKPNKKPKYVSASKGWERDANGTWVDKSVTDKVVRKLDLGKRMNTSASKEMRAVANGMSLLCAAVQEMNEHEVFNFVKSDPVLASECLHSLAKDKQIVFKVA